jgi:hypothetical protein
LQQTNVGCLLLMKDNNVSDMVMSQNEIRFNPIEIQKAKDFLWEYINSDNKKLLVHLCSKETGLTVEEVVIGFRYI